MENEKVLEVIELKKYFPLKAGSLNPFGKAKFIKALDGISFQIYKDEILGLAGESGCGKTTTGNILAGLYPPSSGNVVYRGKDVSKLKGMALGRWKRDVQMIFQDPFNSLNPRFTVLRNVVEPLRIHGLSKQVDEIQVACDILESVELRPAKLFLYRFPHQLSGGQRQRVSLARCLITKPSFIVADEPVSMLDVSIRAAFLELLKDLQKKESLNVLYISHNISEITNIAQRMAVMYLGKIVEIGPTQQVVDSPKHPYTQKLLAAVPIIATHRIRQRIAVKGRRPDLANLPPGCRYQSLCEHAKDICFDTEPVLISMKENHYVACHFSNKKTEVN
jgi:peptide/nickel transport system ATP-binding protein